MRHDADCLVLGGGVAGLAIAAALAQREQRVIVLERASDALSQAPIDPRVSAVSASSVSLFKDLGAWAYIDPARVAAYQNMCVWDAVHSGELQFDCREIAAQNLGYIIENRHMVQALRALLATYQQVDIRYETEVTDVTFSQDQVSVTLDSKAPLTADWIIGADGANSTLRRLCQIPVSKHDYQHTALVTTVRTEKPHQQTAYQAFLAHGPLAFLPLWEPNLSSIVWSSTPDEIAALKAASPTLLSEQLQLAYRNRLGAVEVCAPVYTFPLKRQHASVYTAPRMALVGDAAHTVHPLAGQGLNLGLKDVAALAKQIDKAALTARPIFSSVVLRAYERERKTHNTLMLSAIGGIKQLFSSEAGLLRDIGQYSLHAVQGSSHLKRQFIQAAL